MSEEESQYKPIPWKSEKYLIIAIIWIIAISPILGAIVALIIMSMGYEPRNFSSFYLLSYFLSIIPGLILMGIGINRAKKSEAFARSEQVGEHKLTQVQHRSERLEGGKMPRPELQGGRRPTKGCSRNHKNDKGAIPCERVEVLLRERMFRTRFVT